MHVGQAAARSHQGMCLQLTDGGESMLLMLVALQKSSEVETSGNFLFLQTVELPHGNFLVASDQGSYSVSAGFKRTPLSSFKKHWSGSLENSLTGKCRTMLQPLYLSTITLKLN